VIIAKKDPNDANFLIVPFHIAHNTHLVFSVCWQQL